ncbi:hypothetical protein EUX58_12445 [Pseudomonas sp. 770NI]|nr:hypothetical protein EUX58_12445 [Pseudomonas sp. 770NI]
MTAISTTNRRDAGCVGASVLAKNFQAPQGARFPAFSLTIFASKLAPTVSKSRLYRRLLALTD